MRLRRERRLYIEKGWNGENRSLGREAAGQRTWRNQQGERQKEVGGRKQGMAEMVEKVVKDRRVHLLQCSGSQGGGQGCW